jgi:hypothetical protein
MPNTNKRNRKLRAASPPPPAASVGDRVPAPQEDADEERRQPTTASSDALDPRLDLIGEIVAAERAVSATAMVLHPEHAEYLRARGIAPATIAANGLRAARPQDLPRLAGCPVPDGTSGLVILYDGTEGFCRVRLFPPIPRADGKLQKFGQAAGSPVRFYVPAGMREILTDPERTLNVIEGEVKALALTQAGFPTGGLGGIWSFRSKDLPADGLIPDLEAVTWTGRTVYLVPDSDAWTNEHVLHAVYRLARLLEARGATVLVVKIPDGPDGAKQGADDYLVAKGPAAFRRLVEKAVNLGNPAFKPFREQEKAKAREEKARAREAQAHGDVRAEVDNIRLTPREVMAAFQKRRAIADLITEDLRERGRLLWTPDGPLFFTTATRTVSHLVEPPIDLAALLARYGLNPSESEYAYVTHHLRVETHTRGTRCEAHRLAYYDTRAGVLYVSCFDGSVYRLDGAALVRGDNGEDGVYFRDDPGWTPWEPDLGSSHDVWRPLLVDPVNFARGYVAIEDLRRIWALWTYAPFFGTHIPTRPLNVLVGPKGGGKSFAFKKLLVALFGPAADVLALERDREDGFIAAVTASPIAVFDNADAKVPWLEDHLARVVTGADISRRQLYTTNTLVRFRPRCFVGLTARTPQFRREDVAERALIFPVAELQHKLPERAIIQEIMDQRVRLWGELLQDLNMIVRILKQRRRPQPTTFRLADFADFCLQIAASEPDGPRHVARALAHMQVQQADFALAEDPLLPALEEWAGVHGDRDPVDAGTLNSELATIAGTLGSEWPYRDGRALGTRLKNLLGSLGQFFAVHSEEDRHGKRKLYQFKLRPPEDISGQDYPHSPQDAGSPLPEGG